MRAAADRETTSAAPVRAAADRSAAQPRSQGVAESRFTEQAAQFAGRQQLAQLQRTVAESARVRQSSAAQLAPVLQRTLTSFSAERPRNDEQQQAYENLAEIAGEIDEVTMQAFDEVSALVQAGIQTGSFDYEPFAALGISDRRFVAFVRSLRKRRGLKHAMFGYLIEDVVSRRIGGRADVDLQVPDANARPDIVIKTQVNDRTYKGLVDLTAEGSIGHIQNKQLRLASYTYYEESYYPSVDFSEEGLSVRTQNIDEAQVTKQNATAKVNSKLGLLRSELALRTDIVPAAARAEYRPLAAAVTRARLEFGRTANDANLTALDTSINQLNAWFDRQNAGAAGAAGAVSEAEPDAKRVRAGDSVLVRININFRNLLATLREEYSLPDESFPPNWGLDEEQAAADEGGE